jgi:two-component system, NtrC family, response regulator AtoC
MNGKLRVLVIDDEESIRHMLTLLLRKEGYEVRAVGDGQEGLKELLVGTFDLVLCDVRMPTLDGMSLLDELTRRGINATVIIMSAFGNRDVALEALRRGAYDYIDKPFKKEEVLLTLLKAEERLQLRRENEQLKQDAAHTTGSFQGMIGRTALMHEVFHLIQRVAAFRSTVLISGESGTGKELVARAIHDLSERRDQPFVALNCGAMPESLIESELFGHTRGAFTDAHQDKRGLFQEANKGTLFLDEIAELPLSLQVKLLRVLQEGEIRRVGDTKTTPLDVRIVAASLHELSDRVQQGLFREDLFFRLNVIHIKLPSLRQRREDLPALIQHFIEVQNKRLGTQIRGVSEEAMQMMLQYHWPGNIRELQNCIERGMVLSTGSAIDIDSLPERVRESNDEIKQLLRTDELSIKKVTEAVERILIRRALEKTEGNRTSAAKLLELSHRALLYKIKDYGLEQVGLNRS